MFNLIQESAPVGPLVFLIALIGMVSGLMMLAAANQEHRSPLAVGWFPLTASCGLASLAVHFRIHQTQSAVDEAHEKVQFIIANSFSNVIGVEFLWMLGVALAMVALTVLGAASASFAGGRPSPQAPRTALVGGGLGLAVAFAAIQLRVGGAFFSSGVAAYVLPAAMFVCLLSVLFACTREGPDRSRVASLRLMMGLTAFLALGLLGEVLTLHEYTLAFQRGAAGKVAILDALAHVGNARSIGWSFALVPMLAALFGSQPVIRSVTRRQLPGALLAVGQAAVLMVAAFLGAYQLQRLLGMLGI